MKIKFVKDIAWSGGPLNTYAVLEDGPITEESIVPAPSLYLIHLAQDGQLANSIRGMIARTYFYMSKQYGLRLSKQDRQLYEAWNRTYPVQTWERQRNQTVACVMGRGNEFVGPVNLKACG